MALLAASFLMGCAGPSGLAATEVALTAAEKAARAYAVLPQCSAVNRPICSEEAIIVQLKQADNDAYGAVVAARAAPADNVKAAAAAAAVAVLVEMIPIQGRPSP